METKQWKIWENEIIETINSIKILSDPFHYFYIEPFLPKDLYDKLDMYWLDDKYFWGQNDISFTALNHKEANFRKVVIIDDAPEFSETREAKLFWSHFRNMLRGPELSYALFNKTETYIRSTREDISDNPVECFSNALLEDDKVGFQLGPHVDSEKNLLSLLLYLPEVGVPENLGTCVYQPNSQFAFDNPNVGYKFTGEYFLEKDFDLIYQAPYRSNSLFGLVNEPRAYHGVKKIEGSEFKRRHIQWTITKMDTNPYPSAVERVKNGITPETQRVERRMQELLNKKI